jgi:hypothetical protein
MANQEQREFEGWLQLTANDKAVRVYFDEEMEETIIQAGFLPLDKIDAATGKRKYTLINKTICRYIDYEEIKK